MAETQSPMTSERTRPDLTSKIAEPLRGKVRGALLVPGAPGYDEARAIWNGMIDRHPAAILRAVGAADVIAGVNVARELGIPLAIKGGGHNIAGNAVSDGGLTIDLSPMKAVRVDPARRTATVGPGVLLGEHDREAQAFGLATPLGINSTTGVAGLTLGGGFGWLSRKHGLTLDNLLSATVVTAAGEKLTASAKENSDLFWALRGGSGNFGVVTSFEFKLHKIGTEVLSGLIVHPLADAKKVLQYYRDFAAKAPDELAVWFVLRKAPPLPFLPERWHGKEILALAACYFGDLKTGEKLLQPLRAFGQPIADVIGPTPYIGWQQVLDPLLTPGMRNYWKSHEFLQIPDAMIDVIMDFASRLPDPQTELAFAQLGGAIQRVPNDATAYSHREPNFLINVHTRWDAAANDGKCIAWARDLIKALTPFSTGAVYVNFLTSDEEDRVKMAYGANLAKLVAVKKKYDPTNLFRMNANIRPM